MSISVSIEVDEEDLVSATNSGLLKYDPLTSSYKLNNSLNADLFESSYGFDSVAIKQQKNIANSRLDIDVSSEIIKGIVRSNPLIAANMSTVTNAAFYKKVYDLGGFAFLHRAQTIEKLCEEVNDVSKHCEWVGASVGVGETAKQDVKELVRNGANVILVDIAHGYSDSVIELGKWIKQEYPHVKLVLGNTVNTDFMYEVADIADAVKVGIGGGLACTTKNTAGCTEGQFSAILKFKNISKKLGIPIISCGGIREPADVVKAIGAGANSVMIGSIFAATPESAAQSILVSGRLHKLYAGMASEHVQNQWKNGLKSGTCAEGEVRELLISESVDKVVERYCGALRSGISYTGTLNISDMQKQVKFIKLK